MIINREQLYAAAVLGIAIHQQHHQHPFLNLNHLFVYFTTLHNAFAESLLKESVDSLCTVHREEKTVVLLKWETETKK